MGGGDLGVTITKFCIIVWNNILKNKKIVVTEKVVNSKKPKKYEKKGRFLTTEGRISLKF